MKRASFDAALAFRHACLAALATCVLALPLAGIRLSDEAGHNALITRPLWILLPVAAAFLGRFAIEALRSRAGRSAGRPALAALRLSPGWIALAAALAFAFPLMPFATRYELDLATTFLTYVMLGWGLNIVVGLAGLLDLGYVAFYAVGAYTYAPARHAPSGSASGSACRSAGILAAFWGILLGFPVLRLRGDYLAIVTLGFGEIIRIVLLNWSDVTGGRTASAAIPRPTFFGMPFAASADGVTTALAVLRPRVLAGRIA
jgi:branched-chain amino acid transport system permease protein